MFAMVAQAGGAIFASFTGLGLLARFASPSRETHLSLWHRSLSGGGSIQRSPPVLPSSVGLAAGSSVAQAASLLSVVTMARHCCTV